MRRAVALTLSLLTLALSGPAITAPPAPGPRPEAAAARVADISREEIEWLDVWLPHTNDSQLPRVLLIGDSITRGYYPEVEKALAGRAYVGRLTTSKSLGDPALLKEVALILSEQHYQVIHFNNGLHGRGYSEEKYAQALPSLIKLLRRYAPQASLIWASSTDMLRSFEGDHSTMARVVERNRLAALCAAKYDIPVDDLFPIATQHPEYHVPDGVHFTAQGYAALAAQVVSVIRRSLEAPPGGIAFPTGK